MAIVFICYTAVFLIACVAACSLANSYETSQRQKSAKPHSVIVPTTILIGVFISAIADIVRLVWFSSIETFAEDFIRAFYGTGKHPTLSGTVIADTWPPFPSLSGELLLALQLSPLRTFSTDRTTRESLSALIPRSATLYLEEHHDSGHQFSQMFDQRRSLA